MKLKLMKRNDNHLELAVGGEGHALLNLLQSSLLRNEGVKMAGYSKPHPLMDRSFLYVDTKDEETPEDALMAAAEDAKRRLKEFLEEFEQQVEELKKRQ
jgi:DNA-directed RNA polymerase subunit L